MKSRQNNKLLSERLASYNLDNPWVLMQMFRYLYAAKITGSYLKIDRQIRILDVGCADCPVYSIMMNKVIPDNIYYFGIDMNNDILQKVRETDMYKNHTNIELMNLDITSDIAKHPLKSKNELEKFDIIIFYEVIEHLPSKRIALKTLNFFYSILKDEGTLLLSTPNSDHAKFQKDKHNFEYSYHELVKTLRKTRFIINQEFGLVLNEEDMRRPMSCDDSFFSYNFMRFWKGLSSILESHGMLFNLIKAQKL